MYFFIELNSPHAQVYLRSLSRQSEFYGVDTRNRSNIDHKINCFQLNTFFKLQQIQNTLFFQ